MSETKTLPPESWQELCRRQVQRALAGDQVAARWCAQHSPQGALDPSRPVGAVADVDALALRWKEVLCLECREKLLARLEDEKAAPDAKEAERRQAQARAELDRMYATENLPPVENDPVSGDADGQEPR